MSRVCERKRKSGRKKRAAALGVWDGIWNDFGFLRFFAWLLVMLCGIPFFDWVLLCRSGFFPRFERDGDAVS